MNNSLFGKGKDKILECFYRNRDKSLYFSEILRETKLTPNTTLKHLKSLQDQSLILSNKQIGNTFYKINSKNHQIYSIFSYFDYGRLNELPGARRRAIIEFLDKMTVQPLIVLVFGSTAKKTFTSESDIDILLVFNKKEIDDSNIKKDIEAITGAKLQTFIIGLDYLKEQVTTESDNTITHAIKTGFVVSGHDKFYREILK